jgi:SAM-dependent methyltransferase
MTDDDKIYEVDIQDLLKITFDVFRTTPRGSALRLDRWGPEEERVVELCDEAQSIVDVGCGLNLWKQKYGDKLKGIDLSEKEGFPVDYHGDITTVLREHFEDNSIDLVLNLGGIQYGGDPLIKKQLQEVYRILKPGGIIFNRAHFHSIQLEGRNLLQNDSHTLHYNWTEEKIHRMTEEFDWSLFGEIKVHQANRRNRPKENFQRLKNVPETRRHYRSMLRQSDNNTSFHDIFQKRYWEWIK